MFLDSDVAGALGAPAPPILGKRPVPHIEGSLIKPLLSPRSPQVTAGAAPGRVLLQVAQRPIFKSPILSAAGVARPRRWSGRGEETSFRLLPLAASGLREEDGGAQTEQEQSRTPSWGCRGGGGAAQTTLAVAGRLKSQQSIGAFPAVVFVALFQNPLKSFQSCFLFRGNAGFPSLQRGRRRRRGSAICWPPLKSQDPRSRLPPKVLGWKRRKEQLYNLSTMGTTRKPMKSVHTS